MAKKLKKTISVREAEDTADRMTYLLFETIKKFNEENPDPENISLRYNRKELIAKLKAIAVSTISRQYAVLPNDYNSGGGLYRDVSELEDSQDNKKGENLGDTLNP